MDWSAAGTPLIAARAVHFAATATTVGSIIFGIFIARPVLRYHTAPAISFRSRMQRGIWASLVCSVISGAIWLLLQAASMSGMPLNEALSADVLSTVVGETQFGEVTTFRAGLAICLAACLAYDRAVIAQWLGLAAAVGFAASLAWTGHAGATVGTTGDLHLAADVLHILAAAAWIGGLMPLIMFLSTSQILKTCRSSAMPSGAFRLSACLAWWSSCSAGSSTRPFWSDRYPGSLPPIMVAY